MKAFDNYEIWWVTGAQLLYGGDAVVQVDAHSKEMVDGLNNSGNIPVKVVYKGTANSSNEVEAVMKAANNDEKCVGIITWMHTFSPAKMWIKGLQECSRRHRVRSHLHPYARSPQGGLRLLEERRGSEEDCRLGSRGRWCGRQPQRALPDVRYEHEQCGRYRRRPRGVRAASGLSC